MTTPQVSIILPTYNGARFLPAQVTSILSQTLRDFELISVDDGSTDDTRAIMADFARRDSRVRVLEPGNNIGQKARLWQLAAASQSEFLSVADQDDVWHSHKLERLAAAMGANALAFGSSWLIDAEGIERELTLHDLMPPPPRADSRLLYLFKPMVSGHATLMRRPFFSRASVQRAQPFDWLQALDAVFGETIAFVPDAITYHRVHGGNQSNATFIRRPSLWQALSPASLRRRQFWRYTDRWEFTQRLEHLAFSPLVGNAMNIEFARMHRLCAAAWFDAGRPAGLTNPRLVADMMTLLTPLAGSERDLAEARQRMWRLACSPWRPYDTARNVGAAILTRRRYRPRAKAVPAN